LIGQVYGTRTLFSYPLKGEFTIVVTKADSSVITEAKSDTTGKYLINLKPNSYLIYLKESPFKVYTGPYVVEENNYTDTKAIYGSLSQ
jgi:hypothetical protein